MPLSKSLRKEIAGSQSDPQWGGLFDYVPLEDRLLADQLMGNWQEYRAIENDCHADAIISKMGLGIISKEWEVLPASSSRRDRKAADRVRDQLITASVPDDWEGKLEGVNATNFDWACLNLLDALLMGCAFGEPMWERDGNEIRVAEIRPRPHRRFIFVPPRDNTPKGVITHEGYILKVLTRDNPLGEFVPDTKMICHSFGSKEGNPYGRGWGSKLFYPVRKFKKEVLKFWLIACDKFASPTPVGKYPEGADTKELEEALDEFSQGGWIKIPEGCLIELLESAKTGNADFFERLLNYLDTEVSKCVAGETLTTQLQSVGSLAAAQVHAEIRTERLKAISDHLSVTLNRTLCKWITEQNDPLASPPTLWRVIKSEEDLKNRADRDGVLSVAVGRNLDVEYAEQTYGVKFGDPVIPNNPNDKSRVDSISNGNNRSAKAIDATGSTTSKTSFSETPPTEEFKIRQQEWQKVKDANPEYLMWQHTPEKANARPDHLLLDGRVFRANDPGWLSVFPPCGKNCGCKVIPLSANEVQGKVIDSFDNLPSVIDLNKVAEWESYPGSQDWRLE